MTKTMSHRVETAAFMVYDAVLRTKNRRKPRLLIYTDSRGRNLLSRGKRHYAGSYIVRLQRRYNVTHIVGRQSHTTILDFLNYTETINTSDFDALIMHCGIVDFSPRPLSNIAKVRAGKRGCAGFDELFAANAGYYAQPWLTQYAGENTINLYSPEYLASALLPRLVAIPNLVWITSNPFVPAWDGNYSRGRPSNIGEVVAKFDELVASTLPHVVDLRGWSHSEVMDATIDNIHFSRRGFEWVASLIEALLDAMLCDSNAKSPRRAHRRGVANGRFGGYLRSSGPSANRREFDRRP